MKIPRHIVAEAIAKKTLGASDSKLLAKEIAAYLLQENRINELESILRDIMQYRSDHGIVEAKVISSHTLSQDVLNAAKIMLDQKLPDNERIIMTTGIDETIIGGIKLDMANQQLDMSVRSKLATFKRLTSGERV